MTWSPIIIIVIGTEKISIDNIIMIVLDNTDIEIQKIET